MFIFSFWLFAAARKILRLSEQIAVPDSGCCRRQLSPARIRLYEYRTAVTTKQPEKRVKDTPRSTVLHEGNIASP